MNPTPARTQVYRGKTKKVTGLYERTTRDGTVYEFYGRLPGSTSPTRRKLEATSKSEAIDEVAGLRLGVRRPRGGLTVADVAADYIADLTARTKREDDRRRSVNTLAAAKWALTHIEPALGTIPVAELDVGDVRRFVNALDLAPSSTSRALAVLSGVLRLAKKDGHVARNVVADLDRDDRPGHKRQSEPTYLSSEQVDALLESLPANYRAVAAVCAFAGLRCSEALGLRWADVDFTTGELTVSAQLGEDGYRQPLKTADSARTVPMLPRLRAELMAYREREGVRGLYVFTTRTGQPIQRRNLLRAIKREAGCTVHDLRHSFVSLALSAGVPVHEVSRLAGHKSPAVTMTVYAGLRSDGLKSATDKIAASGYGA